ncbi:trichome birefringence-like protein 19 [Tanacetum coccineum]
MCNDRYQTKQYPAFECKACGALLWYPEFILVKPTNPLPSSSNDPLHVHTNTTLPNLQPPSRKEEHEWVNGYVLKRKGSGGSGGTCDLFSGEWVENPEGPYYTNETCRAIQEHQNCMKFGRTDRDFLKWRWKPYKCELPIFDPMLFLKMMKGKSLAFVGDSVARNLSPTHTAIASWVPLIKG